MSAPGPPLIKIRPHAGDGFLEFFWAPPASDGGSAITNYHITCPGVYTDYTAPEQRRYLVSSLTNGVAYTFSLSAVNGNGEGPAATFRTVEPGLKPSSPQNVSATLLSPTSVRVTWDAPVSDGGADIKWYVIRAQSLDVGAVLVKKSARGNWRERIFTGLTSGVSYTFSVSAVNDPGYSIPAITGSIYMDSGLRLLLQGTNYEDGKSGPFWNDDSGYANNATLEGGTAAGNGAANAVVFDGSTSWSIPALALFSTWSVNVWFKQTGSPTGDGACILTDIYSENPLNFTIGYNIDSGGQYNGGYFDGLAWQLGTGVTVTNGTWLNIQVTYDGTNLVTYVNGSSIGSVTRTTSPGTGGLGIRLGRRWDIVTPAQYIVGEIGEVRIYNRAISDDEVAADFNASRSTFGI